MDLWWFLMGCFRFLEPLAPSKQQQHGSQRLRTRPQSSISLLCFPPSRRALSSLTSLRVRFREFHDGRGRGTAECCMVAEIVVYWRGNSTNSFRQRRGVPMAGYAACCTPLIPWSLYSDSPVSSRPQPLGSRREAALCEDTREDFGLSI